MERSVGDYDPGRGRYERPEQAWECGRAAEGYPCHIGPDNHGSCRVHLECVPQLRDGRWHCTRPTAAGGTCEKGPLPDGRCPHQPLPCQPRRSLRSRRGILGLFMAATALGVLLVFSAGDAGKAFISPGELSVHHQSLQRRCNECHAAEANGVGMAHQSPPDTAMLDVHSIPDAGSIRDAALGAIKQSFQCVECHQFGQNALQPHGLDPKRLAAVTRRIENAAYAANPPGWLSLTKLGPGVPQNAGGQLACALCHQEHRGRSHNLKQISERRCQLCHSKPFHAFSEDHPPFVGYPHKRRMRIRFDHANHYGRHFALFRRIMPDGRKPDSCTSCHTPDPSGARMLVRGFEQSCASCHGAEIESEDVLPGLTFVRLPGLDNVAREWTDVSIGEWPHYFAQGESVLGSGPLEQLPPFMALLLSTDAGFRSAVQLLSNVNLGRLESATPEQKKAVKEYLDAIRRLVRELIENRRAGRVAMLSRMKKAVQRLPDRSGLRALTALRSSGGHLIDALKHAARGWFPPASERRKPAGGHPEADTSGSPSDRKSKIGVRRFGGWTWHPDEFEIWYRPGRHADPFLKAWIDLCCANLPAASISGSGPQAGNPPATPEKALARQFRMLADPAAAGRCLKCHTVDRQPGGSLQVNWNGFQPQPYQHRFTRFSHVPHLKELGTAGCSTCHVLDKDIQLFRSEFVRADLRPSFHAESPLTSGFHAISRQDCATCHTAESAGESCLQCHNYHVGHFPPRNQPMPPTCESRRGE